MRKMLWVSDDKSILHWMHVLDFEMAEQKFSETFKLTSTVFYERGGPLTGTRFQMKTKNWSQTLVVGSISDAWNMVLSDMFATKLM